MGGWAVRNPVGIDRLTGALRSNEVAEYHWWPLVSTIGSAFHRRWHIFTVYTVFLNCFDGKKVDRSSWNPNLTSCTLTIEATSWLEVPCFVQHHYRCRNLSACFLFHFLLSIFISSLSLDCKAKLMEYSHRHQKRWSLDTTPSLVLFWIHYSLHCSIKKYLNSHTQTLTNQMNLMHYIYIII